MADSYKPEGYNVLSPYLMVTDAVRFKNFLREVFQAEALRFFTDENGRIRHGEMRLKDSVRPGLCRDLQ